MLGQISVIHGTRLHRNVPPEPCTGVMPVSDIQEVVQLIESGNAAEVVPTLEYLAGLFPASVTVQVLLARAYEAEGHWRQALETWQWASVLMPNSPAVREGLERTVWTMSGTSPVPAYETGVTMAPELVPPESDEFVDLTEQPEMAPYFYREEPAPPAPARQPAPASVRERTAPASPAEYDDLDRLIEELESARITPDPDISSIPAPEMEDEADDVVSETLARIYAAQRQFDEAARVYELLAAQQPDRAKEFFALASEMRSRAAEE